MTDHGSEPYSHDGSRRDGIDIEHRLQEMEKQRQLILQATDDERLARCMRLVGADLGATRRVDFDDTWTSEALHALRADLARVRGDGFQRASELHEGIRAHREGQR